MTTDRSSCSLEPNFGHVMWYNLAGGKDPYGMLNDPLFFPGLRSDELLEKIPPMVVLFLCGRW